MKITLILQMRNSPLTCPAGIESEWDKFYSVEDERFLSAHGRIGKEREVLERQGLCYGSQKNRFLCYQFG